MGRLLNILLVFWLSAALGEDLYIAQTAQGSDNGTNAANAHSLSWGNDVANWGAGAGKVSPGDTLHLCGTFTGALIPPADGTAGNYVTILAETNCLFTSACWTANGAIQLNGRAYLILDGGTNGTIKNTANGTSLATQNNSRGIGGNVSGVGALNNGIIRNWTVVQIYVKVKGVLDDTRSGYPIDVVGTELTITGNYVGDGDGGLGYSQSSGSNAANILISHNTLRRCNHLMTIGVGDLNCSISNLRITQNDFDDTDVWDDPGNTPIHLDGIIILNNSSDPSSNFVNLKIDRNHFGANVGTRTTAAIFVDLLNPAQNQNCKIINNLFLCASSYSWGNGFIASIGTDLLVANNTCIGTIDGGGNWGGGITAKGQNVRCYNNILWSGSGVNLGSFTTDTVDPDHTSKANVELVTASYLSTVYSNYNVIVGSAPGFQAVVDDPTNGNNKWLSGLFDTLHNWTTRYDNNLGLTAPYWNQSHADPNSNVGPPVFITGTYVPAVSDTAARGQGVNLSSDFTEDYYGNPRPSTGAWVIGAFQNQAPLNATAVTIGTLHVGP